MSMSWVTREMVEEWEAEWKGMPEFVQENLEPIRIIKVQFATEEDAISFGKLVNQKLTPKTKWIWYPAKEKVKGIRKEYVDES